MAAAATKAIVHPQFSGHVETLTRHAQNLADSVLAAGRRLWALLPGEWSGNPDDVPGLTGAFDRSKISDNYERLFADPAEPGVASDVIGLAWQSDFVAARERAFRMRSAGSIRCHVHAAARRRGHADPAGVLANVVLRFVQDTINSGAPQAAAGG